MTDNTQYKARRDQILEASIGTAALWGGNMTAGEIQKIARESAQALDELFLEVMSSMELPMGVDRTCMRMTKDSIRKVIQGESNG